LGIKDINEGTSTGLNHFSTSLKVIMDGHW
jgi:hypothetical protein